MPPITAITCFVMTFSFCCSLSRRQYSIPVVTPSWQHPSRETQSAHHLKICHEHYATLTTVFPKFSPVKMPVKAVGTCSTPSTMCILNFMLPSLSHPPSCSCIFPRRCSQVVLRYD